MAASIADKISISCSGQVNKQWKRLGFIPAFFIRQLQLTVPD
jgi:hypothetical protein